MNRESSMTVTIQTPVIRIAELYDHLHIGSLSRSSADSNSVTGREKAYGRMGIGNPLRIKKSCSLDISRRVDSLSRPSPSEINAGSKTSRYKKCSCLA
jgi:hypothetical protein